MVFGQARPFYEQLLPIYFLAIGADQRLSRRQMLVLAMNTWAETLSLSFAQFDDAPDPEQLASAEGLVFITLAEDALNAALVSIGDLNRNRQRYVAVFHRTE